MKKRLLFAERAFTLIELLVVIAILGILAAGLLTIINPVDLLKKARDSQRKQELLQVRNALESYYADNGKYPSSSEVVWGEPFSPYLMKMPKDPGGSFEYSYQPATDGSSYRLFAKLERCDDNQVIDSATCSTTTYNYSVTSPNLTVAPCADTALCPVVVPTSTPAPTSTPEPTATSTPTPTVTPTSKPLK
ncbi:MAG: prepilin-type N-terminal cleavage/methylation domain-containing protein [Candidatus Levyibacteriota bacterium]|nr:MAG: prepilin-type N-terminal cleavage/methylation domain-containing protein [Candidatus Levybacteria bacterium]